MSEASQAQSNIPSEPPCRHEQCSFPQYESVAETFFRLRPKERIQTVRNMLFATTAPKGEANLLKPFSSKSKKRKIEGNDDPEERCTIVYACLGQRLCMSAFASMVCLSEKTLQRHAEDAVSSLSLVFKTRHGEAKTGMYGPQRLILEGFFKSFGYRFGMESPSARGSQREEPLKLLPSHWTNKGVYESYVDSFKDLVRDASDVNAISKQPEVPLSYNLFRRYWRADFPTLRITREGSDFCDLCTALKDDLKRISILDERHLGVQSELNNHRQEAQQEFEFYRQSQSSSAENPDGNVRHLVFDFAEKILLPRLQHQPGQLHFVTGLKFDLFGVSCSNSGNNFVFGLAEGHWPNEKTANVVASMLHHVLSEEGMNAYQGYLSRNLKLHADNCSGQNKNRFILWYLCWRVICGLNDRIDLYFLVSGHTKNVCDGAFGHVKRGLKSKDARCPGDMMKIIDESSKSNKCIPGSEVRWMDWKKILSPHFSIPTALSITKYHVFTFKKEKPGVLFARYLTSSEEEFEFNLISRSRKKEGLHRDWIADLHNPDYCSNIVALEETPSPKHKTRRNYLKVNILDRYYKNDPSIEQNFFGDGHDALQ